MGEFKNNPLRNTSIGKNYRTWNKIYKPEEKINHFVCDLNAKYLGKSKEIADADSFVLKSEDYQTDLGIYEGQSKNKKADGKGRISFPECVLYATSLFTKERKMVVDEYTGFKRHVFSNCGYLASNDGNKLIEYVGDFKDGKMEGKGRGVYANLTIYKGQYENNKRCGPGILSDIYGKKISEGIWENDKLKDKCLVEDLDGVIFHKNPLRTRKLLQRKKQLSSQRGKNSLSSII